ncbi:hypothetical protein [Rhizobium nepotum]|uniref:hypothetical protein n=1 Tax=Rhizobium nepotum TaxID=1035271 RepID=UPI003CF3D8F7
MPEHLVASLIACGNLVSFEIEDDHAPRDNLIIDAAHKRGQILGPAGRWPLNTLQSRVATG